MEGCRYCCSVWYLILAAKKFSRPSDDIILEIAQLVEQGVREVNLFGQNVNAYRGATHDGAICTFAELLRLWRPSTVLTVSALRPVTRLNLHKILSTFTKIPQS